MDSLQRFIVYHSRDSSFSILDKNMTCRARVDSAEIHPDMYLVDGVDFLVEFGGKWLNDPH